MGINRTAAPPAQNSVRFLVPTPRVQLNAGTSVSSAWKNVILVANTFDVCLNVGKFANLNLVVSLATKN